jgi:hypothetical protein
MPASNRTAASNPVMNFIFSFLPESKPVEGESDRLAMVRR